MLPEGSVTGMDDRQLIVIDISFGPGAFGGYVACQPSSDQDVDHPRLVSDMHHYTEASSARINITYVGTEEEGRGQWQIAAACPDPGACTIR